MKTKMSCTFGLLALAVLTGCNQPGSGACNSTQSQLVDSTLVRDIEPLAPAGGYIHFENRACTVTLMLTAADSNEIKVKAYTAQHCAKEHEAVHPKVYLSIYLPTEDGTGGGYLKNLPAKDDFFTRREQFIEAVEKLGINAATELARNAVLVPALATHLYKAAPDESEDPSAFAYCLDTTTPRLTVPKSQQVCWSSLDSGVRQMSLKQSELGVAKFNRLKAYLEKRKENHDRALRQVKQFSNDFNAWTQRVSSLQGANRLFKYGPLGIFLNENVCKNLAKDDKYYPVCSVRPILIDLAEKYLVETDLDGSSKNILKKLDEMGLGIKSPYFRTVNIPGPNGTNQSSQTEIRDIFREKALGALIDNLNGNWTELAKLFAVEKNTINTFGKHYTIATNPVIRNSTGGSRSMFGLIRSAAFFGGNSTLPAVSLSASGALRFYLPQNQSKIFFNPTDSGSMITFGGIIPLLVLHTVDDKPVSGGASILALPEAQAENIPSVGAKQASIGNKNVAGSSDVRGGVEVQENDYVVSPSSYIAGCR